MSTTAPSGDFSELPVVDLGRWRGAGADREAFAAEVREICHHVGFFLLSGHGVPAATTRDLFATVEEFFDLPEDRKLLIDKTSSPHLRGWERVGTEYTNNRPDVREQIDLWSEHAARQRDVEPAYLRLLGPNQWLPDEVLPGFRRRVDGWFAAMGALAAELLQVLSVGLGLDPLHLEKVFGDEQMSLIKLIHYPPTPPEQFGVNAHHDTGFLTVLAPGETPGLQVQNAAGAWIDVPIVPDTFVINLGEMLQVMTGNYFVATPHRVATRTERHSIGYFHGPSLETRLDPLPMADEWVAAVAASPRHASAGLMARRDETLAGVGDMASSHRASTYGEQVWNYFCRSYPDHPAIAT